MNPTVILIIAIVVVAIALAMFVSARRGSTGGDDARTSADGGLRKGIGRSRSTLSSSLAGFFSSQGLSDDEWADLEDGLISADVGPEVSAEVAAAVRARKPESGDAARSILEEELVSSMLQVDRSLNLAGSPSVIVVVGVNGTGKTTSIAKLARGLVSSGSSVVLGAADTYRAAADTQLKAWGETVGVPVVSGESGADPASVAFASLQRARSDSADVLIVDTAGRLHSQTNLMDELGKIVRVLKKDGGVVDEVLLVLDGSTGQNGIVQAVAFTEAVGVTGVVLTKLDGTARGGVAIAVEDKLGVPIKFIGIGEGMDDLIPFVPTDFVDALIAQ